MKNWPAWLPCPSAWMSALFLTIFAGSIAIWSQRINDLGMYLAKYSHRFTFGCGILAIVFPIIAVAVIHHFFHVFLDTCFPDSQASEGTRTQGFFPTAFSWWEGLYSWLVLVLATILTAGIIGMIMSYEDILRSLYVWQRVWYKLDYLLTFPTFVWVVVAAYLYQFEHVVRQKFMAAKPAEASK
jgi:hypothetical protein